MHKSKESAGNLTASGQEGPKNSKAN